PLAARVERAEDRVDAGEARAEGLLVAGAAAEVDGGAAFARVERDAGGGIDVDLAERGAAAGAPRGLGGEPVADERLRRAAFGGVAGAGDARHEGPGRRLAGARALEDDAARIREVERPERARARRLALHRLDGDRRRQFAMHVDRGEPRLAPEVREDL